MSVDSTPDSCPVSPHENRTKESTGASSDSMIEQKTDFALQVQRVLADADALNSDEEHKKLCAVLLKYQTSFAKDSLDCSLTTIHSVQIPTPPNAPPTYVRQYKIPLASYEPVQEIIDDLLEKGIIRPCNSTYSAPLWPVLNPNGKW
ncbi:hypothetical protein ABVT39_011258 [Epinephelus coioides]